jgi:L-ascorbate metabolism protein UlaG (beta-lactamase superfamily)
MQISKFGHSCLLITTSDVRVLIDPGSFSSGFEGLTELDGLFLTHQHHDHYDHDRVLDLLSNNRHAQVVADEQTALLLAEGAPGVKAVRENETFEVGGLSVSVHGREHVVIHPELVNVANVGYFVDDKVFHPGDALTLPGRPVDVLALPIGAPWLTVGSAIEYLRAVKPRVALAVHERVFTAPQIFYNLIGKFAAEQGTEFRVLGDSDVLTV